MTLRFLVTTEKKMVRRSVIRKHTTATVSITRRNVAVLLVVALSLVTRLGFVSKRFQLAPLVKPSKRKVRKKKEFNMLLYITTHWSQEHIDAFRLLWPVAVAKSPLLQEADVFVHTTTAPPQGFLESIFVDNHLRVEVVNNMGYQRGAKKAMKDAVDNGWFTSYEWVMRVNPDVIIRNDTWIRQQMRNYTVDAILDNCKKMFARYKIHTDFFVMRPERIWLEEFANAVVVNSTTGAEYHATSVFRPNCDNGTVAWLYGSETPTGACRVGGPLSPVIHKSVWMCEVFLCIGHKETNANIEHCIYNTPVESIKEQDLYLHQCNAKLKALHESKYKQ